MTIRIPLAAALARLRTFARGSVAASAALVALLVALLAAGASAAPPCYPNVIYKSDTADTNIYAVNERSYVQTLVGQAAFGTAASGLDPVDGKLYYVSQLSASNTVNLGSWDPATGTSANLGQITGIAAADLATGVTFVRATFDANGVMFAQTNGTANLYTINVATRAATNLGAVTATTGTIPQGFGDFTYQPSSGLLYSVVGQTNADSQLYTINTSTLKATLVGNLGLAAGEQIFGIAFADDGSGYAIDNNGKFYKLDLQTGAATYLLTLAGTANDLASLPQVVSLDMGLVKTHANAVGTAGGNVAPATAITYTVTVTNPKSSTCALQSFSLNDPVPATVQNPTFTASTGTYSSATGAWTGVNLQPNSSVTLTVSGTVAPTATGTIVNTATITLPDGINNTGTGSATDTATVTPTAGLTIAKTGTTQAEPNGLIAYTVVVSNAGPSDASGAAFADTLPAGEAVRGTPTCSVTSGAAACGAVTVAGAKVSSTIAKLPANSSVTFAIDASAAASGTYGNTASVAPPTGVADPNPTTSSVSTTVAASNGITKTVANVTSGTAATAASDTGKPGDTLLYTLTYTNTTGVPLANFAFADVVPANTAYVANSAACAAPNAACTIATTPATGATTSVKWSLPSLASGATFAVSFKVTIK